MCRLLSEALQEDRCVSWDDMARKRPCELWCQPALPLNTQQLSERPRGIRVVIHMLKIVALPSLTPYIWINDSSILFYPKLLLTFATKTFNPIAAGQGYSLESSQQQSVCWCLCLCVLGDKVMARCCWFSHSSLMLHKPLLHSPFTVGLLHLCYASPSV